MKVDTILIIVISNICFYGALTIIVIRRKQRKFVKDNSIKYHKIQELKEQYAEYTVAAKTEHASIELNTLNKYRSFDHNMFILNEMSYNEDYYKKCVSWCEICRHKKKKYDELFLQINQQQSTSINELPIYLSLRTFEKLEHSFIDNSPLVIPTDFVIKVSWGYKTPAGRNSYCSTASFRYDHIKRLLRQNADTHTYKATARYQRSLMTPTLRTNILERDDRRCAICGASASDGSRLHVDHIVPIAKGGKTIESNLRVLCDRCNLGKSDKILSLDADS